MSEQTDRALRYTPNQVVAYNLRQARLLRGWTQEEAAAKLEDHLGELWSSASYSVAERSTDRPERIRQFTADEIVAFSRTFQLPITWFFFPPDAKRTGPLFRISPRGVKDEDALSPAHLIELILGDSETQARLSQRVDEVLNDYPVGAEGPYLRLLDGLVSIFSRRAINQALGDELDQWVEGLRGLVVRLEEARNSTINTVQGGLDRAIGDYHEAMLEHATSERGADEGPH